MAIGDSTRVNTNIAAFNAPLILVTMKEKVTQARSDTLGVEERNAIKDELSELAAEIQDTVDETVFNKIPLLDGTYIDKQFQTGEAKDDVMPFSITDDASPASLSVDDASVANMVSNHTDAGTALDNVNTAMDSVSSILQNCNH